MAYQPFDPKEVGNEITFLFGPLSGGNHAKSIINDAGYLCEEYEKAELAQFIKNFYKERRKGITDEELLVGYFHYRKPIDVDQFEYSRSSKGSGIEIKGKFFDESGEIRETSEGKDSALAALKKAIDAKFPGITIQSHTSESDGTGINAKSVSTIVVTNSEGGLFEGVGVDQDIEISAMRALINAVNKAYVERNFRVN